MRVVVVDDDAVVARSLEIVLGAEEDIEVVGRGSSGPEAVRLARELEPDVLLLDIRMPGGDGLVAAERVLEESPNARVVFLTTFSDDEYVVRALALGARGYLIKEDVDKIAPALRSVMSGQSVLEGDVLERAVLLGGASPHEGGSAAVSGGEEERKADLAALFPQLTEREREVVSLIAEGLDNREVAAAAYMGEGTVRNHISSILAKLGLRNRTQIAVAYWRARR